MQSVRLHKLCVRVHNCRQLVTSDWLSASESIDLCFVELLSCMYIVIAWFHNHCWSVLQVYVIDVTWNNSERYEIYRRYSDFFSFQVIWLWLGVSNVKKMHALETTMRYVLIFFLSVGACFADNPQSTVSSCCRKEEWGKSDSTAAKCVSLPTLSKIQTSWH